MSRHNHRHGERGHARPIRPEAARPSATPMVGPALRPGGSERPALAHSPVEAPVVRGYEPASGSGSVRETASAPMSVPAAVSVSSPVPVPPIAGDDGVVDATVANGVGAPNGAADGHPDGDIAPRQSTCTTAQLRRFIKSRAYLPMHELRRRFAIEGAEDDVTGVDMRGTWVYVGLPDREGSMLGELLRGGEVGFELSHDPVTPVIVGVFPMRPIPRS